MAHTERVFPRCPIWLQCVTLALLGSTWLAAEDRPEAEKYWPLEVDRNLELRFELPADPTWRFIKRENWKDFVADARALDGFVLAVAKDREKPKNPAAPAPAPWLTIGVWAYQDDDRFVYDGREFDARNIRSFAKAVRSARQREFQEIKNDKEVGWVVGYAFAQKILKFSFSGTQRGGTPSCVLDWFFKINRRVFYLQVIAPSDQEAATTKALDELMKLARTRNIK